jgi:hypothetical protein
MQIGKENQCPFISNSHTESRKLHKHYSAIVKAGRQNLGKDRDTC